MEKKIKHTPLHEWHLLNGANMGHFASYEMPIWYPSGAKEEHLSVIRGAGLFDTSHMAFLSVTGEAAIDLLQKTFSRDLIPDRNNRAFIAGKCVYGVFLNEKGWVIDDAIIYGIASDEYLVVVNAGNNDTICKHLQERAGALPVRIEDLTGQVAKIDIQGPASGRILQALGAFSGVEIKNLSYFTFAGHFQKEKGGAAIGGIPVILSRTGYTGEFGFEIISNQESLTQLWDAILNAGKKWNLLPCGLAARDSLRTGALLPLSHQDIGHFLFLNTPWMFALPLDKTRKGFTKSFTGSDALLRELSTHSHHTYPFAGFDLRKVSTAKAPAVITGDGKNIGTVLTCVTDMALGRHEGKVVNQARQDFLPGSAIKGLSCGFLRTEAPLSCLEKVLLDDGTRRIEVEIVNDIRPDRSARADILKMVI